MLELPTVLLRHEDSTGCHYDWMIADPRNPHPLSPNGLLWTARCSIASTNWHDANRIDLEPIPPHRREYLDYQGPISNGRGSVVRVDSGGAVAWVWNDQSIVIQLAMKHCIGTMHMQRAGAQLWRARMMNGRHQ